MLLSLILGCAGFVLFFVYDINSITRQNRILGCSFFAGCALIVLSTALSVYRAAVSGITLQPADIVLIGMGILSFACMIYCLFFALPFEETYVDPENGRSVYDKGVYAMCRHPGVIFFFLMYLFIGLALLPSDLLICGMVFSLLNLLYAAFQDCVAFPKTFYNYADYKKYVPFIIPNIKSIRLALKTLGRVDRKAENK